MWVSPIGWGDLDGFCVSVGASELSTRSSMAGRLDVDTSGFSASESAASEIRESSEESGCGASAGRLGDGIEAHSDLIVLCPLGRSLIGGRG